MKTTIINRKKQYTLFGISVIARTHEQAMHKFKLKNFSKPDTTEEYIEELNERIRNFCHVNLTDYETITDYVNLLVRHGFMKINELH
jgi:hypothetical protein